MNYKVEIATLEVNMTKSLSKRYILIGRGRSILHEISIHDEERWPEIPSINYIHEWFAEVKDYVAG